MADLTWYSREGADQRFLTRSEAGSLASREGSTQGDAALSARIDAVKATAEAALPAATAEATYATKEALAQAQLGGGAQAPDLSSYATKAEMQSADSALGTRIDSLASTVTTASSKADAAVTHEDLAAYPTSSSVAETYVTKAALGEYLPKTEAAGVYATKSDLANAQLGGKGEAPDLSHLATKAEMTSADSALGQRIDQVKATADAAAPISALAPYLTSADAQTTYATKAEVSSAVSAAAPDLSTYATKESLSGYLTSTAAAETYSTKKDLDAYKAQATSTFAPASLAGEVSTVKETADAALPKDVAATTYATKEELTNAQLAGDGKIPDLSGYLTAESATATYATKADVEGVRSAIPAAPDLAPYLTSATAASTYATKADLAQAQAGGKVDLSGYLTATDADGKYATKDALSGVEAKASEASTKAATAVQPDALSAYATTEALAKVKQAAEAAAEAVAPPFRSGERYSSPVTYYWPDYYDESKGTSKWAKALKAAGTLGIVILNKDSGNWDEKNEDFGKQAARALAAGARRAVFYVKTQYGVASLPSNDPARNGVPNPDKYTKEYILGQIAKFTEQYGEVAQGVFLDETINGWGAQAGRVQWYKDLIAAIREQYGQSFYIVVNAGSNMSPEMCALDFDTAMMFEQDAGKFLNEDANAPVLPDHMRSYPSEKWWAVIHGVTKDNYRQVFEKLDTLPIGHAYITDGVLVEDPNRGGQWEPVGNPYANPPSEQLIRLTSSWIRGTLGLHLEVEDLKAQLEALKKGGAQAGAPAGAGQAGKLLVLGPNDPLPQGVTDDTVIVRREA